MVTTRRGRKNNEDKPLLEVTQPSSKAKYDAAIHPESFGRGKLRFAVRQQVLAQRKDKAGGGTYKSIFAPSKPRPTKEVQGGKHVHSAVYNYLNPKSHSSSAVCFQQFITLVIIIDVVFYIISTEPKFEGMPMFYYAECVTSTIFLVEYLSRLYVCTEQVSLRYINLNDQRVHFLT